MLGNDVIDLDDIDARPETFRPRFDERIFCAEERRVIARDAAPPACRWAHWGAKEAAYKLVRQIDSRFVFSPIQLTPRFEPAAMASSLYASTTSSGRPIGRPTARTASKSVVERCGTLQLPERSTSLGAGLAVRELEIRSFETPRSVHVVALPAGSDWDALVFGVEELAGTTADLSGAVRALAVREIGRKLGVEPGRLEIGRREKIPTIELDGRPTRLSLSLSHHGRFVAFAMMPALDLRNETDASQRMIFTDHVMDSVSPKVASE